MSDCNGCKYKGIEIVCKQCKDSATVPTAKVERADKNALETIPENKQIHKIFSVHVHSRTNKLADSEGRSIKSAIDGLVLAGLLPDDNPSFLPKIPGQTQEKKTGPEETIITITEIQPHIRRYPQ